MRAKLDPVGFLSLAVLLLGALGSAPAWAVLYTMPEGSTVWMTWGGSDLCGEEHCAASNQLGPDGIPMTSLSGQIGGFDVTIAAAASVYPDAVHAYIAGYHAEWLAIAFVDTYTVHGTASGPFDITAILAAEGSAFSQPTIRRDAHLLAAGLNLRIGEWDPVGGRDTPISGSGLVNPYRPYDTTMGGQSIEVGPSRREPYGMEFASEASYTRTVSVGDTFTNAYLVSLVMTNGVVDMLNTTRVSFDLPDGVYLTSALGGTFGLTPVPVPPALWLFGSGLLGLLGLTRRR
jgi:hypothetical protein